MIIDSVSRNNTKAQKAQIKYLQVLLLFTGPYDSLHRIFSQSTFFFLLPAYYFVVFSVPTDEIAYPFLDGRWGFVVELFHQIFYIGVGVWDISEL